VYERGRWRLTGNDTGGGSNNPPPPDPSVIPEFGDTNIDAVEGRLGGDCLGLAGKVKAVVGNVEDEVLGHFVPVEHGSDFETDYGHATQRLALAGHRRGEARQFAVAADDQAFAGKIR
jgi:hypothetical protein